MRRTPLHAGGLAAVCVCLLTGCFMYVDCRATVLDAETGEPIDGATVAVSYTGWPKGPFLSPRGDQGITNDLGQVILRVTRDRGSQPWWRAEAPDYLYAFTWTDRHGVWDQIERSVSTPGQEPIPDVTLELWAEPAPTVIVVVPDDYRGFVRICHPVETRPVPAPPRQRLFECVIDATGLCELPAAPILQRNASPWPLNARYEFRLENGTPVPVPERLSEGGETVGAWPLWSVDGCQVFVIGSEMEACRERELLWPGGVLDRTRYPEFGCKVRQGRFATAADEQPM